MMKMKLAVLAAMGLLGSRLVVSARQNREWPHSFQAHRLRSSTQPSRATRRNGRSTLKQITNKDIDVMIRDAFRAARPRLQDYARRLRGQ